MFIINSKKLIIIIFFSLIISFPLLFGSGCASIDTRKNFCCFLSGICGLGFIVNPMHDYRVENRLDSFSLCDEQKKDCVEATFKKFSNNFAFTIMMPYGTDIRKLVAYFKYRGANVYIGKTEQVSGKTANDFTRPVVYRVQSRGGSSAYYYVKVIAAPEKTICAFYLTGCQFNSRLDGVIDQNTKTISVMLTRRAVDECKRSGRKFKAHFIYSGSSIIGPEENDFSSPVVYTVKAKDGSSVNYTVTTTIAPEGTIYKFMIDTDNPFRDPPRYNCSNNNFSDYCALSSIPDDATYRGHVDQKEKLITVNLPVADGIDVKKLTAHFEASGLSVFVGNSRQISGKRVNDFTYPVIYRVKDSHAFSDYTVKVNIIPEKTISEFFLSECVDYCEKYYGVIDEKAKTISVVLPADKKGKGSSSLKANFTYSGSSVFVGETKQISGITENDFSSPVVYRVTARDGSSADYTATVTFQADTRRISGQRPCP